MVARNPRSISSCDLAGKIFRTIETSELGQNDAHDIFIRIAFPSSVSKRYSLPIRTHGKSCRRRAGWSLSRVSLLGLDQIEAGRKPLFTCSGLMVIHRFISFLSLSQLGVARATDDVDKRLIRTSFTR